MNSFECPGCSQTRQPGGYHICPATNSPPPTGIDDDYITTSERGGYLKITSTPPSTIFTIRIDDGQGEEKA